MSNISKQNLVSSVHPNSLVTTKRGTIPIKYVVKNDVVFDNNRKEVVVKNNITLLNPTNQFVRITKNALNKGIPKNDLYIKDNQIILHNNLEKKCVSLLNDSTIKRVDLFDSVFTHFLVTENASFVVIENIPVSTLKETDWKTNISKEKLNFKKK